ncbi:MAG: hypothetical protein VR67_17045 [Peptococcaceae bacterium BRH_c8a]|nr:MAG: hypothetical protein VR67_17045 [Peptococcaceae bacterium BRH_c8a]
MPKVIKIKEQHNKVFNDRANSIIKLLKEHNYPYTVTTVDIFELTQKRIGHLISLKETLEFLSKELISLPPLDELTYDWCNEVVEVKENVEIKRISKSIHDSRQRREKRYAL